MIIPLTYSLELIFCLFLISPQVDFNINEQKNSPYTVKLDPALSNSLRKLHETWCFVIVAVKSWTVMLSRLLFLLYVSLVICSAIVLAWSPCVQSLRLVRIWASSAKLTCIPARLQCPSRDKGFSFKILVVIPQRKQLVPFPNPQEYLYS